MFVLCVKPETGKAVRLFYFTQSKPITLLNYKIVNLNLNTMRQITKYFETSRQAERYLGNLYGMYSYVRLIIFPRYSEAGTYIFEVQ